MEQSTWSAEDKTAPEIDPLVQARISKLDSLRNLGIDPYPARFNRTATTKDARARIERLESRSRKQQSQIRTRPLTVAGRIMGLRSMGKAAFADMQDGEGRIQLHLRADRLGASYSLVDLLDLGDFVGASGPVFRTRRGEISIEVKELTVLAKAIRPMPDKWSGLQDTEKRYRQRYLDLISSERSMEVAKKRAAIIRSMRDFLHGRGFVEVETPVLVSVAAGGMASPFVTHHKALDRTLYLRIATELHLKRMVIGGMEKVFEIGRLFRNEGIDRTHNPDYTSLESYEAYVDYKDVMAMVEQMVFNIAMDVNGVPVVSYIDGEGPEIDFTPPWPRLDLREQVKQYSGIDFLDTHDRVSLGRAMEDRGIHVDARASWGRLLDKVISSTVEPQLEQPSFLVDYPVEMSPLAKRKSDSGGIVERFEAFIGGSEIANAFTELNDPVDQRSRFEEQERLRQEFGEEELDRLDEDFLVAVEHGMPPTGGLGMGIDRLAMLLTGERSIREVILFPQLRTL